MLCAQSKRGDMADGHQLNPAGFLLIFKKNCVYVCVGGRIYVHVWVGEEDDTRCSLSLSPGFP